eukprot:COSAG01_NODE_46859_length_396_cov_0.696970_1_plen_33_part_01
MREATGPRVAPSPCAVTAPRADVQEGVHGLRCN